MNSTDPLSALFSPSQVAIVGASRTPGKIGHAILANMLDAGFKGQILPVNPSGGEILGLPVIQSVPDIPGPLDLAVICVPPQHVIATMESLAEVPTRAAVVITAGFKETGGEGYHLEEKLASIAKKHNIAMLGPNCLGLMNTQVGLNTTFAEGQPRPGNIAFFSQSGALCVSILDWSRQSEFGFSKFISIGNKAVLDESDILAHLGDDDSTNVILGYIENIDNGARFLQVAREVTRKKPVILIKAGTTAAGARAASSHTGAIAGSDNAYEAAFRQAGVLRVNEVADLFNLAQAFASQRPPDGPNLCIVTNAGGPGILAADACEQSGLTMAEIGTETAAKLAGFLPPFAALYNPVDIIGDADDMRIARTLSAILTDEAIHSVLVLLAPTRASDPEAAARAVITQVKMSGKTTFACLFGGESMAGARRMMLQAGIPCYPFPKPAVRCMDALFQYRERALRPEPEPWSFDPDLERAKEVIAEAREQGLAEIVEFQAQDLFRSYGLPLPETRLARTSDKAVEAADAIGYPVVLKIASPQISHKSDVGGVKVNLKNSAEVRSAFLEITSRTQRLRKSAYITGCLVQAMGPRGSREVIVGFKRDPQFGPLVLFGLGGIYVEVLKDVSFRLAPLSRADAQEMIREIRSFPLLRGVRGEASADLSSIEDILLKVARMAVDFPEIYEAECNPVLAGPEGAFVADARVILGPEEDRRADQIMEPESPSSG